MQNSCREITLVAEEYYCPAVIILSLFLKVIDAGHFWAQPGEIEYSAKLAQLMNDLNDYNNPHEVCISFI